MSQPIDSIEAIVTVYSCLYVLVAVVIAAGILRFRRQKPPDVVPSVSIIVCARNEERTIRQCIESLVALDYPADRLEIVLVDDESDDATRTIMEEYSRSFSHIRVLSTEHEPRDFPGKQRPLNLGIRESHGEIILVTDADCTVQPGWVYAHIAAYRENVGIVGGITKISTVSGRFFDYLQNCDQVSKLAVAMGCAGLGCPLTVMGNNMSFRRDAYEACGGFKTVGPSIVEDVDLMYCIISTTPYCLGWIQDKDSTVISSPLDTITMFVEQRWRMLGVCRPIPFFGKVLLGIECVMASVFTLSLFVLPWKPTLPGLISVMWLFGTGIVLYLVSVTSFSGILFVPVMLMFEMLYGIILLKRNIHGKNGIVWKGREYEGKLRS